MYTHFRSKVDKHPVELQKLGRGPVLRYTVVLLLVMALTPNTSAVGSDVSSFSRKSRYVSQSSRLNGLAVSVVNMGLDPKNGRVDTP